MFKLIRLSIAIALLTGSTTVSAWWGTPWNRAWNDSSEFFGNGFTGGEFSFSMNLRGQEFARGWRDDSYPSYGYPPYYTAPYGYGEPAIPQETGVGTSNPAK